MASQTVQKAAKTWFVTGTSRGIGAAIVKVLLEAGENVVATARDPKQVLENVKSLPGAQDRLLAVELDVTSEAQGRAAVERAIEKFGRIDVLVNNAGFGHFGVFEETTDEEVRRQFDTNVFGMMTLTRLVAPKLRQQRSGHIFNISSIGGLRGIFGGTLYATSKFAVEGFSQSLAIELAAFGVHVTSVAAGYFRTDFLDAKSVQYSGRGIEDYATALGNMRNFYDNRSHAQAGDPEKLAAVLKKLSEVENPPVTFVAGTDAVNWLTDILSAKKEELERWKELSLSTDLDSSNTN